MIRNKLRIKNFKNKTFNRVYHLDIRLAKRAEIGFSVLMLGLIFTVSAYAFSFMLTNYTDYCIVDGILDSINQTKLENCISKNSDWVMSTYYIGFVGIILLAIAAVLFAKISFKKSNSTETNISKNSNFDTKIIALGLAIIAGLVYTRVFENEFFKDLILVGIPVIVGSILAPTITRKWQTRSAKIKIKKEILESFAKSAQYQKNTLHQFVGLFIRTYGKADKDKYDSESGISSFTLTVPLSGDDTPKSKLKNDYEQMNHRYDESKLSDETVFISLIRLYFRDEDIVNQYLEIQKKIGYLRNFLYDLMQDHELGEYQKLAEDYHKEFAVLNNALKDFSKKIVEKDITV